MKNKLNIFRSIFPRLILIVLVFGIFVNIAIWAILHFSTTGSPRHLFPKYLLQMNEYVINDLGYPPDTLKAKKIAEDLLLNIRFQSHNFNFSTSENVPTLEELSKTDEFKENFPYQQNFIIPYSKTEDRGYSIFKDPRGIYILAPPTPQDFFNPERAVFLLVVLVSAIFIPLYVLLRLMLSPIKSLSSVVHEIGKGKYDVVIPVKRNDELGELADSIKSMAGNIKHSMKSKEQLLIDVSHELRSPLTRIKLGLEVDSPKDKINEDVMEMENMITGLLDSYKADSSYDQLKIEKVNLKDLFEDIKDEYDIDQRVEVYINGDKDYFVNGDPTKLLTVIRNLVDNSLKYSNGIVNLKLFEEGNNVIITVSDKGIGIPEKDIDFIFEPFYRSDPSRSRRTGGFGLGLSIAKKIMDAHKGTISVKSKLNEGSEFKLSFLKA